MSNFNKIKEKKFSLKDNMSGYDKKLILKTFRLPNGVIENFFITNDNDSVQILPITSDGKVITVRQYRPGEEEFCVELPGGGIEHGEDPKKAAERELTEETGYAGKLRYLGKQNYNPYSTGTRYMFVADNCRKVDNLELDQNEFLQVKEYPMSKFKEEIKNLKIRGSDCAYAGLDYLGLL